MATEFTIQASPGTDVWRKPPVTDIFNAPRQPPPSTKSTSPLSAFRSARISFLLPPLSTLVQYDQAGLLLSFSPVPSSTSTSTSTPSTTTTSTSPSPPKWLKTGVEVYNGVPRAATVGCDTWADWSLGTVSTPDDADAADGSWVTVEVVNATDNLGKSLWVYQVVGDARIPLREVCWPFGQDGGADAWEVTVEAYTCRPNKEDGVGGLSANFKDFEVTWG